MAKDRMDLHSFPTRRSSDLAALAGRRLPVLQAAAARGPPRPPGPRRPRRAARAHPIHGRLPAGLPGRSEEHTSELQSRRELVCRLLLEKKNVVPALMFLSLG